MDYLKDKQEYINRYDLGTIEQCLDMYWGLVDNFKKHRKNKEFQEDTDEDFDHEVNKAASYTINIMKGERYRNKYKTIEEWMERDKKIQDKQDNTPEPENIRCLECGGVTKLTSRDLHDTYDDHPYMLFMYECLKCKKRRVVYEDGREWKYEKPKCPKCKSELKIDIKIDKDITTFIEKCPKCSYKNIDVSDHKKFEQEQAIKEKRNRELLEKNREEFCSDEKGKIIMDTLDAMAFSREVKEAEIRKYDDPAQDIASKLKILDANGLEKLLIKALEKAGYSKLMLEKPELGRFVMVPFTLQDTDSSRKSQSSTRELEKLFKDTLEGTNWRLLSGSLMCRLGFISGRLKGCEDKEDLLEMSGYQKEKKEIKFDQEKMAKYGSNGWVQLAIMEGQHIGIENVRKRRLAKEPDGFFLGDNEGPYNCTICHEQCPGNEIWWIPDALWCADCRKNIKEGAIPPLVYDDKHKIWFKDYEIKEERGVQSATKRKLERDGLLHPRNMKNREGWIYCTVYLVKENKEFLEKYPKVKKVWPKAIIRDSEGKEIEL